MTLAACCPIVGDAVGAAVGDRDAAVGAAEGTAVGASDADELKGVGAWEKKRNEPRRQRGFEGGHALQSVACLWCMMCAQRHGHLDGWGVSSLFQDTERQSKHESTRELLTRTSQYFVVTRQNERHQGAPR